MYSPLQTVLNYLLYYFKASSGKGHGIHSPFIFNFITRVLHTEHKPPELERIESLRQKLKGDRTIITVDDFGAGEGRNEKRSVASIARRSLKSQKFGRLFYRMVKHYSPENILELGTSLGITTCYLSVASPAASITTLEGSGEVATLAEKNFSDLGLSNIQLARGNFDDTLDVVLAGMAKVDLAFIDGNHRQAPTESYFHRILSRAHNDTIVIIDDIHWSREMESAWKNIREHASVTASVDLYFTGIVFFRQEFREKQHFIIRF